MNATKATPAHKQGQRQVKPAPYSPTWKMTLKKIVELLEAHPLVGSERKLCKLTGISRTALRSIKGLDRQTVKMPTDLTFARITQLLDDLAQAGKPLKDPRRNRDIWFRNYGELRQLHINNSSQLSIDQTKLIRQINAALEGMSFRALSAVLEFVGYLSDQPEEEEIEGAMEEMQLEVEDLTEANRVIRNLSRSLSVNQDGLRILARLVLQNATRLGGLDKLLDQLMESDDLRERVEIYEGVMRLITENVLPENRMSFLIVLARNLKDENGVPFDGDATELLRHCGLLVNGDPESSVLQ